MKKRISIFGSSLPVSGDPMYQEGLKLGRNLGERGHTILTGGYIGIMEAVSKGASEFNATVIGVTCDEIEAYRPISPNRWITHEIRLQTLHERIYVLISECDIALALTGGIGTLNEIVSLWNNLLIGALPPKPMILIGDEWKASMEILFNCMQEFILPVHRDLIAFATDSNEAVGIIDLL